MPCSKKDVASSPVASSVVCFRKAFVLFRYLLKTIVFAYNYFEQVLPNRPLFLNAQISFALKVL